MTKNLILRIIIILFKYFCIYVYTKDVLNTFWNSNIKIRLVQRIVYNLFSHLLLRFFLTNLREMQINLMFLILSDPCISESCIKIKINLNVYFRTSLWCLGTSEN